MSGHDNGWRRRAVAVTIASAALWLTACGDAGESGVEQLIEEQSGGDVDINSEDGSFSVETEEGSMTVDEDGNFVVTGPDGSVVSGNAEDGNFTMEGDDGGVRVDTSGDIPEEWPDGVPAPEGIEEAAATVIDGPDGTAITISGRADASFAEDYASQVESAGFEETANMESDGNVTSAWENGEWNISIFSAASGDSADVTVTLNPAS